MLIVARLSGEPRSVAELVPPVDAIRRIAQTGGVGAGRRAANGRPALRIDILGWLRRDQARFVACSGVVAVILAAIMSQRGRRADRRHRAHGWRALDRGREMSVAGLPINGINTVLPTLVFAIGLTDSIHLMIDLQRRRGRRAPHGSGRRCAASTLAFPSFLTALTTATGLGSLTLAHGPSRPAFWPVMCRRNSYELRGGHYRVFLIGLDAAGRLVDAARAILGLAASNIDFSPLVEFAARHYKAIVVVHVAVRAVLLAISMNLTSDIYVTESIAPDLESVTGLKQLDDKYGGGLFGYVTVQWPALHRLDSPEVLDALAAVHEAIERQPEFSGAFSVQNLLIASANGKGPLEKQVRNLRQYPTKKLHGSCSAASRLAVSFHMPDIGTAALRLAFERLDRELSQIEADRPGFQLHITGTIYVVAQNLGNIIRDLQLSLAACSLLVFAVIGAYLLRSLRISIISLLPDMLPLLVTSTILVAFGEPLRIVSMLTFCLCFAISVDDTIHFLVRFQRARQTKTATGAVEK